MDGTSPTLTKLAAKSGANLIGYKERTVSERLSDTKSILDYPGAAEGRDHDSTAAFTAAYAEGKYVYVPEGDWFTKNLISNRTYGEGRIWCIS